MPYDLEESRLYPLKNKVSLSSVAVLHGINYCVMSLSMCHLLQLDYEANKEPIQDIGISSNSCHISMPRGGSRLLQSVLLRRTPDKTAIAVVNPVLAPFMEFDFVLGSDYLASIGIDWPKDVKKIRPIQFETRSFLSSDSVTWPIDIDRRSHVGEVSPFLERSKREHG